MVKGEDKQRGTWKIGRIDELFVGEDGVIKVLRIKTAKTFLEEPVQLLYAMELHCDSITDDSNETELGMKKEGNKNGNLNPEALTFRPKRTAAAFASDKHKDITENTGI